MGRHLNRRQKTYTINKFVIAIVWILNGFFCKVLLLTPRHKEIIGRILGNEYASMFNVSIGIIEICMAIWILTGFQSRLNAITQITIIASMNVIEFILAPDLLLWGRFNALFAFLFVIFIGYNEYILKETSSIKAHV